MEPLEADDPRVIGAYRLLGRLGAGGMGRVYLGRSAGGRTVAVKSVHARLAADEQFRARFRREVESARRVGGAWTAPVLDADPDAPVPWVATGYVAGPSLTRAVEDFGPLDGAAVRTLGAGLAEALTAVHAHGLVHRDVKPSNVMLTLDGPLLIDFGIARAMDGGAALTATGVSVGSPGYMAPEQILGRNVTGACDVFSLGAVLAYAATGAGPFTGDSSAALLYKVVHEDPDLGAALTGELREVTAACLAKRPEDRPAPGEIARRLGGAVEVDGAPVRTGWLPAPLVERVSRQAVELLNLEGRGDPQAPAGEAAGGFGPPDSSYGANPTPSHGGPSGLVPFDAVAAPAAHPAASSVASAQPPPPVPPPVPPQPQHRPSFPSHPHPSWPTAGAPTQPPGLPNPPAPKERRLTLTSSLGGGADSPGHRRLSCTLVLSVAGALAAATTAAFVFQLLPGQGSGEGGKDAAAKPPGSGQSTAPGDAGPNASAVPKAFLGTWTGTVLTRHNLPNGTITSTITPGAKGDYVVRTTYDFLIARCEAKAELVSATAATLTLRERTDGKPGPGCTGAEAAVTYTLGKDGTLAFASDDEAGGRPRASLKKAGG
ncbi:serine/threonine-protein kinase [Streptomyces rimosus]|uniref:serine/threonine-protein kinase n=1 Tax=Streptomyces rimosus TaxID=1927 RepID=UPI0004C98E45|nr:serine/threonine-protein kinase [Streptomyces rimosus]